MTRPHRDARAPPSARGRIDTSGALFSSRPCFDSSALGPRLRVLSTPVALPGLSGPPQWKGTGVVRTELNEPRWAAAPLSPIR